MKILSAPFKEKFLHASQDIYVKKNYNHRQDCVQNNL